MRPKRLRPDPRLLSFEGEREELSTIASVHFFDLVRVSGEDAKHLGQRDLALSRRACSFRLPMGWPTLGVGVVRYSSHAGDGPGGNLELLGDYYGSRDAVHLQFYTVVQTALAAGASVPDGEDCCVALLGDLLDQVGGSGAGGVGLGEPDDTGVWCFLFEEGRKPIQ